MAEASPNGLVASLPAGLLEQLTAGPTVTLRAAHVARARRHAAVRAFDDREVVVEIASQLLLLSAPA